MAKLSNQHYRTYKKRIDLLIMLALIRPHFSFLPGTISVYLFDAIILLLLFLFQNGRMRVSKEPLISVLGLMIIMGLKALFGDTEADLFLSIIKIVYYVLVFNGLRYLFQCGGYTEDDYSHILNIVFIVNIIVAILQLLDPPVLGDIVHAVYGTEKLRSLWTGYPRIYGTFFNANWFGVYLVFMVSYYTSIFFENHKVATFLVELICIIGLLFVSGSRTAMIGTVLVVIITMFEKKQFKALLYTILLVSVVMVIAISVANKVPLLEKTLARFTSYFSIFTESDSMSISNLAGSRYAEWITAVEMIEEKPLLGTVLGDTIPHNTYLSLLLRYGILGCVLLIPFFAKVIVDVLSMPRRSYLKLVTIAFYAAFLVIWFSGDYLFSTQVMLVAVILLAAGCSIQERNGNG